MNLRAKRGKKVTFVAFPSKAFMRKNNIYFFSQHQTDQHKKTSCSVLPLSSLNNQTRQQFV